MEDIRQINFTGITITPEFDIEDTKVKPENYRLNFERDDGEVFLVLVMTVEDLKTLKHQLDTLLTAHEKEDWSLFKNKNAFKEI